MSTDFIPWALSTVSVHGEISINFRIKFSVSFSIKQIQPLEMTLFYLFNSRYCCPKERKRYTKASENQDLNDFVLETLA